MRSFALLAFVGLLLAGLAVPTSSAIPPVCLEQTHDATIVSVTIGYGGGIGCYTVGGQVCTLEYDRDHPSHPYWKCRDF